MWNLKYSTNEPAEQKQITDMENRLVFAKVGGGSGMPGDFGVSRRKLLIQNGKLEKVRLEFSVETIYSMNLGKLLFDRHRIICRHCGL